MGEDIYVVRDLTESDGPTTAEAHIFEEAEDSRTFTLSEVIDRLLVDEEIVLFKPNYLTAL